MELPKNITQIEELDPNHKIYIEDYVMSYIKQLNDEAVKKNVTVAFYGRSSMEESASCYYIYGAYRIFSINQPVKHLSAAQLQETEKIQRKSFPELSFIGYCRLRGELIEEILLYDQDLCISVKGYARFYEKNESMLEILLENQSPRETKKEEWDKADKLKRKQDVKPENGVEKNISEMEAVQNKEKNTFSTRVVRVATTAIFSAFCVGVLLFYAKQQGIDIRQKLQETVSLVTGENSTEISEEDKKEKEPRKEETLSEVVYGKDNQTLTDAGTIITETQLEEAILEENQNSILPEEKESDSEKKEIQNPVIESTMDKQTMQEEGALPGDDVVEAQADIQEKSDVNVVEPKKEAQTDIASVENENPQKDLSRENKPVVEENKQMEEENKPETEENKQGSEERKEEYYEIQKGDTLISISMVKYGTDSYVEQICKLNNIKNPDNIQMGQKILLP